MKHEPFVPIAQSLLATLTEPQAVVILEKSTERPFIGMYTDHGASGTYYCRQCSAALYVSNDKFSSGCGWPAFDDQLPHAVDRIPDADLSRTEIRCATCGAHLGHVFNGEHLTRKNVRHCVNSVSLVFQPGDPQAKAVFAGGCFWGMEYLFKKLPGVISVQSGYCGGSTPNPSYQDVLTHTTGHLESVEVTYNPLQIPYGQLARYFFEIHDPTQTDGQGPDIGNQYLSAVFYRNRYEYDTGVELIGLLETKGYAAVTQLRPASHFWPAEAYHQDYYMRKGTLPYCHTRVKRFQ